MKLTTVAKEAFKVADDAGATLEGCWEAAVQAVRAAVIEKMIEPDADLLRVIKSAMDPATTSARHVWRMAMLEVVSRK